MLRREVKFVDFDGEEKTNVYYFHMTKAEILEFNLSYNGGLAGLLEDISKERDLSKLVEYFKKIILASYGERDASGRFYKNAQIRDAFQCTEAYSALFMELATDDKAAVEFINGIVPKDIQNALAKSGDNPVNIDVLAHA